MGKYIITYEYVGKIYVDTDNPIEESKRIAEMSHEEKLNHPGFSIESSHTGYEKLKDEAE